MNRKKLTSTSEDNLMKQKEHRPVTIAIEAVVTAQEIQRLREVAYCAGLFDGDGSVFVSHQHIHGRKNPTYRLCLSLVQNDLHTVENFQRIVGLPSHIVAVKRKVDQNKQVYDLRYYGEHSLGALRLMHNDLVRKRWESEVAQQFWVEALMGVLPGPNGLPPGIWKVRESFRRKLSKLK